MGALRSRFFSALCALAVLAGPLTVPAIENGSRLEEVYDPGAVNADSRARPVNEIHPERSPIPGNLLARRTKDRNAALMISVDAVMKDAGGNQAMVLVDVRDAKDFEAFRIPGSINIPPYALKMKQFLRDGPVVLIAEGHSLSELEQECGRLRGAGFRASILEGGLREWMRRHGPLAGNNTALARERMRMSPRAFFEERHYSHWVVLDACQWKRGEAGSFIPEAIPLPCPDIADDPRECFKAARYKKGSDSPPFFLIFTDEGKGYEIMERRIQEAGIRNVFFLQGGLAAYEAFLEQQSRLVRAEDRKKEKDKKCSSCP